MRSQPEQTDANEKTYSISSRNPGEIHLGNSKSASSKANKFYLLFTRQTIQVAINQTFKIYLSPILLEPLHLTVSQKRYLFGRLIRCCMKFVAPLSTRVYVALHWTWFVVYWYILSSNGLWFFYFFLLKRFFVCWAEQLKKSII